MTDVRPLSDQVLLSMLLGSDVANQLTEQSLSVADLFGISPDSYVVRECEALYIAQPVLTAAKELLTRALASAARQKDVLSSPGMVRNYLRLTMGNQQREVFVMLCLDARHHLNTVCELFQGSITETSVYPREVVKHALQNNAKAVIFAHNHPSGSAIPSEADQKLTRHLMKALALIDIRVLDHLVIGSEAPYSFAENGLM